VIADCGVPAGLALRRRTGSAASRLGDGQELRGESSIHNLSGVGTDDRRPFADRPSRAILTAVFLMSASVLVFEVALTRLFSVVLRYHFVFLVTSVAVCGLGLGGLLAHVTRAARERRPTSASLVLSATGFGVLVPVTLTLLLRWLLPYHPGMYVAIGGVILLPFICAGVFLSVCFEQFGKQSGRLYAADLFGAAAASFGVVGLLQWLGGINACFAAGAMGALAGVWAAGASRWLRALPPLLVAAGVACFVAANHADRVLGVPAVHTTDQNVGKPLYIELADPKAPSHIEYTEWNAFARTDVVAEHDPSIRYVYTDGHVPTNMDRWDGKVGSIQYLRGFLGYVALESTPKDRALFIGPGGGLDVLMALVAGYREIEGVEINPSILNVMRRYRKFNGGVYERPNVHVSVGDGRSYVKRSRNQYDLIYLALTQTATSGNVGLSLVESYIHTTDAIRDYLAHLTPGGCVAFITQEYPLSLRLFASAIAVLTEGGTETEAQACSHLAVMQVPPEQFPSTPYRYLLLLAKEPLQTRRCKALMEGIELRRLLPLYVPAEHPGLPFSWVGSGEKHVQDLVDEFQLPDGSPANISPCSDDSPFFLDMTFGVPRPLYLLCLAALLLSAGLTGVLALTRRGRGGIAHLPGFTGYFSLLGVGFMLAEIALAQKLILFLGYPTLTLSVILFSLLLGGAAGSRFSQRGATADMQRWIATATCAAGTLLAAYAFGFPVIQPAFLGGSLTVRIAVSATLLVPLGFCLGIPFPSGIRLLEQVNRDDIPWMWGVNGVTSVLGSVLAAIGAKLFGFRLVLLAGAACYLLAALLGRVLGDGGSTTPIAREATE